MIEFCLLWLNVLADLLRLVVLGLRSNSSLAAENLFLRKQLWLQCRAMGLSSDNRPFPVQSIRSQLSSFRGSLQTRVKMGQFSTGVDNRLSRLLLLATLHDHFADVICPSQKGSNQTWNPGARFAGSESDLPFNSTIQRPIFLY